MSDTSPNGRLTVSEAVNLFLIGRETTIAKRTMEIYRLSLAAFTKFIGEDTSLESVTVHDLRRYRSYHANRGITSYTAYKYIREVKTFYNWLEAEGVITVNPSRRLHKMELDELVPKVASPDDIAKAIEYINARLADGTGMPAVLCRAKFMIYFLADTGCRAGGLLSLTLDRLDLANNEAIVFEKGRGGKKKRSVFFCDATKATALDWLMFRPECTHDYVLATVSPPDLRGQPVGLSVLTYALKKVKEQAGIKGDFNPHAFRHGAARTWLKNGADLATVSQLLGHSGIDVTAGFYATWATSQLKAQHGRFGVVVNNLHLEANQ